MICYKVVRPEEGQRFSCNVNLDRADDKSLKKLKLNYEKGKIVKAAKGTMGIFVFKNLDYAEDFAKEFQSYKPQIIKVRNIGKLKERSKIILPGYVFDFLKYLKIYRKKSMTYKVPQGTFTCPAVEVLE